MPGLSVRITGVAEEERPAWTSLCVGAKAVAAIRGEWLMDVCGSQLKAWSRMSKFQGLWMLSV